MTRFTPDQIDHLLDNAPKRKTTGEVPAGFFDRNAEEILRRCRPAVHRSHGLRRVWMAAAAVMLIVVTTFSVKSLMHLPSVGPAVQEVTTAGATASSVDPDDAEDELYQAIATLDDDEIDEWNEIEESDIFLDCM